MQELCRKDAGRMQEAHLPHFLTISCLSITFPSGRREQSLAGGAGKSPPSSCTSLLLWLCCTRDPLKLRFLPGFSKGSPCAEPREQRGLNAAWPRQSTAMAGTKQNKTSIHGRSFEFPAAVPSQHTQVCPPLLSSGTSRDIFLRGRGTSSPMASIPPPPAPAW